MVQTVPVWLAASPVGLQGHPCGRSALCPVLPGPGGDIVWFWHCAALSVSEQRCQFCFVLNRIHGNI